MRTTCRSCPTEVEFVPSAKTGKPMILDAEPSDTGNVVVRDGRAVVLGKGAQPQPGEVRRMPHHATCPAAASWKGRTRTEPKNEGSLT